MDVANELLDAIEIIVDKKIRENTAQIYPGVCKSVSGNTCVVSINGKDNTVRFYGSTPSVDLIYRVFVPNGNMSMAFIITGGGDSGGSSPSGVTSYKKLTDLPSINGVILQEGATSKSLNLYGTGNEPSYPVTKVNNKAGAVTLDKTDVGLGNVPNVTTNGQKPTYTQASSLANIISGEKLSVSMGKIMKAIADLISHLANKTNPHEVTKTQVGLGNVDNTSDADKPVSTSQATAIADAKKAGTDAQSSLSSHINNKSNPHNVTAEQIGVNNATLTIQKNGETVNTFTANSSVDKTVNITVPTTPDDIGAVSKDNISQTLGSSITKVPSEKAVSDAISSAGGGDMLKSVYDPNNIVANAGGIAGYAVSKSGDTMTGNLTVGSASMQTNGYVTGTWFQTTANTALNKAPTKIAVLENGWVYSRTPEQIKSDIGLSNVDNVKQYSSTNPPPYPVTSVNGKTGAVTIDSGGVAIAVQSTQPTGQNTGDFWYETT